MMNEQEESKHPNHQELSESWIESLLVSATRPQDHSDRVARAMSQIETGSVRPHSGDQAKMWKRCLQWSSIGVAASVLLALFLLFSNGGTQSAMAAVQRSLNAAAERIARKYLLQVEFQTANGGTRRIDNDFYVQGDDRFALRHPGLLPGNSFWLGQDGNESWVLPAFGPVLKGHNTFLSRWLRSQQKGSLGLADITHLHVTTLLKRMSRGYQLEALDDEEIAIPESGTVVCQHIRARRQTADQPYRPDTIELWASRESGMAVRLIARWELKEDEIGRESVVLTFQSEEPSLSDAWFTAEGHYEGSRPIVRIDAAGQPSTTE
jgi:hypothetical protein